MFHCIFMYAFVSLSRFPRLITQGGLSRGWGNGP